MYFPLSLVSKGKLGVAAIHASSSASVSLVSHICSAFFFSTFFGYRDHHSANLALLCRFEVADGEVSFF